MRCVGWVVRADSLWFLGDDLACFRLDWEIVDTGSSGWLLLGVGEVYKVRYLVYLMLRAFDCSGRDAGSGEVRV